MNYPEEHYIFYLEMTSNVTKEYLQLSTALSEWGISLIPVSVEAYIELWGNTKRHAITIVNSIESVKNRKIAASKIDLLIQWKRITLYELTSFEQNKLFKKIVHSDLYTSIALPVEYNLIAKQIASQFYLDVLELNKWPGKRRVPLSGI